MQFRNTGGPLDMGILGLVKTHISGKSHSENQKVVILHVHDFSLICEKKNHIWLFVYSLTTRTCMIYKTNQSFEFFHDKFSISRIFTLKNRLSRILGEPFEKSLK